jgi:hypothetical protein
MGRWGGGLGRGAGWAPPGGRPHRAGRAPEGEGRAWCHAADAEGRTAGGNRGVTALGAGVRKRGCRGGGTPMGEENEELSWVATENTHLGRRPSLEPRINSSIDGDLEVRSTNWTHRAEALDEMNAVVPSDFANDARIASNCSSESSPELEPLRTSASNSGRCEMNLRKPFYDSERAQ